MVEALLKVHFPLGSIPARGFRCPACGDERLLGSDAEAAQTLARRLGLYGVEDAEERKLLRTGGSVAVTLPPRLLEEVLDGAEPGDVVRVGRQGGRIVVEAGGSRKEAGE